VPILIGKSEATYCNVHGTLIFTVYAYFVHVIVRTKLRIIRWVAPILVYSNDDYRLAYIC